MLWGNKGKAKRRYSGPELDAVYPGGRHRPHDAIPYLWQGIAGQERLHAEEVGVKYRSKDDLVDGNFREYGQSFRSVIEVTVQEHEPVEQSAVVLAILIMSLVAGG